MRDRLAPYMAIERLSVTQRNALLHGGDSADRGALDEGGNEGAENEAGVPQSPCGAPSAEFKRNTAEYQSQQEQQLFSLFDAAQIDVVVLNIDKNKQEISLGMKQTQANPWDKVAERYPAGTVITGTVRNLTNYGAFIEIEEGIDGLLHVSDMSWVRKVGHPSDVLNKGDKVKCIVLNVDQERKRIALGLKQMANDPWEGDIPGRYHPGDLKKGKVTKLTNFGVFVELEAELSATRLLTWRAAWMMDRGLRNSLEASIAKAKAGQDRKSVV